MQRAIEEPIEIRKLNLDSAVPSEIKSFWGSSINKETPVLPQSFFVAEAKEARKIIVLSDYVTDNDGSFDRLEMKIDEVNQKQILTAWKKKLILGCFCTLLMQRRKAS